MNNLAQAPALGKLQFAAVCEFMVPHPDPDADLYPSITRSVGDYDSHEEALSACVENMRNEPAIFCVRVVRRQKAVTTMYHSRAYDMEGVQ